jgi:hypothetical protein
VAVVKGRRKTFDSGSYYIRFTGSDGNQKYRPVGKDPAVARAQQIAKQSELDSGAAGIEVKVTDPTAKEGNPLADAFKRPGHPGMDNNCKRIIPADQEPSRLTQSH